MNNASPFEPIPGASVDSRPVVRITLDGEPVEAFAGDNLAAVLLAAGHRRFRDTAVSGAPRGPFCMMGACYDCLVEIDGVSRQACMIEVSDGMVVRRHRGRTADA